MRQVGVPVKTPARGREKSLETMQPGRRKGVKASAVEVGETGDRADIQGGTGCTPDFGSSQQSLIPALDLGGTGAPTLNP